MAHIAQADRNTGSLTVLDDRGNPDAELALPETPSTPEPLDAHLAEAGWRRSAAWTDTDTGWQAPVIPA